MKKKVLLLHGWFQTPEGNWFPSLKKELENKGYQVSAPQLVDKDFPTLSNWTKSALENFQIDSETSIIGHSLGVALALRLVEESAIKIDKLITVSGWDLTPEHETFFAKRFDYDKIITNTTSRTVIHSNNDPYVTEFISREFAKRIQAEYILIPNGGHFLKEDGKSDFPEIVELFS